MSFNDHDSITNTIFITLQTIIMKDQQQEKAKELYFQTNMSKTAIAENIGVARKTVLFWAKQGNWDQLRMSARNMPSLVAEKCYYLINQYLESLLVDGTANKYCTLQLRHAQTIHLLATTIKKLKNRSTVNESMEMFNFFLDGLNRRDPELAEKVAPQMEEYIRIRKNCDTNDFLLEEFRQDATLPYPEEEIKESWQDEKDEKELAADFETFLRTQPPKDPSTATASATAVPFAPTTPAESTPGNVIPPTVKPERSVANPRENSNKPIHNTSHVFSEVSGAPGAIPEKVPRL
jgi:DNA-binding XRE family transcriptional regulator